MPFYSLKPLPLGNTGFSTLRNCNQIYVDKTELIYRLASRTGQFFLTRPRRFGKSLLISTFESLFAHGLRDFQGLAIEKLWKDKPYKVLHLDFSLTKDCQTTDEFLQFFEHMLKDAANTAGISLPQNKDDPVAKLISFLSAQQGHSLVLLIDEYDAPLTAHLDNAELFGKLRSLLSRLYSGIKAHSPCLRFFLMTGITKLSNTGIFSAFNNLIDISLSSEFGCLLGYTEEELSEYFGAHLKVAAQTLELTESELRKQLKVYYNGFSFDDQVKTHVYCPWSILNFLNDPSSGFVNYWFASGGQPTVLLKYLQNHALADPAQYDEPLSVEVDSLRASRQFEELDVDVLLTQTGYLTAKRIIVPGILELGYPNREVSLSMARLYADELLRNKNRLQTGIPYLPQILADAPVENVVEHFNQAFNAIDYHRYPINDEASCRAYLQVLLLGAALMPDIERHSSLGRSDLEVNAGNRRWVFEFKYAKVGDNIEKLLQTAVDQMKNCRYGQTLTAREILRVVLVYSEVSRSFAAWSLLDNRMFE